MVIALEYLEPGDGQDPDLLERLRGLGTSVTVKDAEQKTVSVQRAAGIAPALIPSPKKHSV